MEKIDYRSIYKHLYQPKPGKVEFLTIPPLKFLMIDGEGNPNTSPDYTDVVSALYTIAYTLKFTIKKRGPSITTYWPRKVSGGWTI